MKSFLCLDQEGRRKGVRRLQRARQPRVKEMREKPPVLTQEGKERPASLRVSVRLPQSPYSSSSTLPQDWQAASQRLAHMEPLLGRQTHNKNHQTSNRRFKNFRGWCVLACMWTPEDTFRSLSLPSALTQQPFLLRTAHTWLTRP